jgi:hypothetical protein
MTPRSSRTFAIVFAVVFALVYVVAVEANYALFTYHPAVGEWGAGVEKPREGPAMYWFGWLATTGIIAAAAGAAATLLPESVTRRLPPSSTWVVATGVMVVFCYLLGGLFLR